MTETTETTETETTETGTTETEAPGTDGQTPAGAKENEIEFGGERFVIPEQFFDKEKKTVNLAALLKSQSDLRRKVGAAEKAPDAYTFDGLTEKDQPMIDALDAFGHQNGVSQEKMNGLLELLGAAGKDYETKIREAGEAEFDRLFGEEKEERAKAAGEWIKGVVGDTFKDDPAMTGFVDAVGSSPYLAALVDAVKKAVGSVRPVVPQSAAAKPVSAKRTQEELDSMIADPRYGKDPAFTADVDKAFEAVYGG